jgi:geranylgeranyl pyrophosphate synthase
MRESMKVNRTTYEKCSEELLERAKKILEMEGSKGWELARGVLLTQKVRNSKLKEAIKYIANGPPDYFRPAILSLCCKIVGGKPDVTAPYSVSFIFLGKAIGIHDDIIDNLKTRNGRQTFYGKFGKEVALILSDILLFKGFTLLQRNLESSIPQKTVIEILSTIDRVWFEQSESEILEVGSRKLLGVPIKRCIVKIKMRASEFEAITRIGGLLGRGSQKEVEILGRFGRLIGMASLLREEIIDMLELDVLKHRITYESLPLPIIYAAKDPKFKSKIASLIFKKRCNKNDLKEIVKISDIAGGINYVANHIVEMIKDACKCLRFFKTGYEELNLVASSLIIREKEWKRILQFM